MKKRIAVARQVLFGLLVASVITFGSVEVVRGFGGTTRAECTGCPSDAWCTSCCKGEPSICLEPDGQCLCG